MPSQGSRERADPSRPTKPRGGNRALFCAVATGFGTVLATQGWLIGRARRRLAAGRQVAADAPAPNRRGSGPARLLVVGDSTGVGVGSGTPAQSLHGRLQVEFADARIVNRAEVGARVADVATQLAPLRAGGERFDLALVLAGGDDILQMTPLDRLADDARTVLQRLRPLADTVVWMGCADVGLAPCFIAPFNGWLSRRSRHATRRLAEVARGAGVDFIDFVDHPLSRNLRRRRDRYFAVDGVHPSALAYGCCYQALKECPAFIAFAARERAHAAG